MKHLLSLFTALCVAMVLQAQVSKTVNLTTAGTLASVLTADEKKTITDLTITGNIDARDFVTMRDLMLVLAKVDMSAATVVEYIGTEGTGAAISQTYAANEIPSSAFYNASNYKSKITLQSFILPNSITSTGYKSFYGCGALTIVSIPNTVTTIGNESFHGCAFTSISIPNSVTKIGCAAFEGCSGLTSITIPNSVTTIGELAFANTGLISIVIPNAITEISIQLFSHCSGLTSVSIPNSVIRIWDGAFEGCSGLASIKAHNPTPATLPSDFVFNEVSKTIPLYVPIGSKAAYAAAAVWKDFTNIIEFIDTSSTITNYSLGIEKEANTRTIKIFTSGTWTATSTQPWLTITPASGDGAGEITITAAPNTTGATRTATITIASKLKADGGYKTITVTQAAQNTAVGDELAVETIIYPNPTQSQIIISAPAAEGQLVSLIAPNGAVIAQTKVSDGKAEFSAVGLAKGIYNVQLQTNDNVLVQRVVVE